MRLTAQLLIATATGIDWLNRHSLEAVLAAGDFPVPDYREFDATTAETRGNLGLDCAGEV